jgi:hypothetical protein
MTQQYDLFTHYTQSSKMKFNDHKTIQWLIYEIGYLNDAILLGDIVSVKHAQGLINKKFAQAKRDLAKDGITDSFFMASDYFGKIALSYEYKYPDGFTISCKQIVPTGQIK